MRGSHTQPQLDITAATAGAPLGTGSPWAPQQVSTGLLKHKETAKSYSSAPQSSAPECLKGLETAER